MRVLTFAWGLLGTSPALADPGLRDHVGSVLNDDAYQDSLPGFSEASPPLEETSNARSERPPSTASGAEGSPDSEVPGEPWAGQPPVDRGRRSGSNAAPPSAPPSPPQPLTLPAELGQAVFWVLVILMVLVVIAVLAFALARAAIRRRDSPLAPIHEVAAASWVPQPERSPAEFASDGSYGEAVHAMLLLALGRLASRGGLAARHSATSREILDQVELEAPAREHLATLVSGVEAWWFGGQELSRDQYDRCVAAWAALQPQLGVV
ncbi:MAG: DUF4129 domain-containing protein [Myxococcota bacterium]